MRHTSDSSMHTALDFYSLNPTAIFARSVGRHQPTGVRVAARAQRSENERDGETEWHGEEEGSGGED